MPSKVTNYQCPSCTGPLQFDSSTGDLACEFCGSHYPVAEIEAMYARKNEDAEAAQAEGTNEAAQPEGTTEAEWDFENAGGSWGDESPNMRAYNCPSCGAELVCDETTAATSCPYCGNPTVVPGQLGGMLKPDYVIPFKLDKDAAVAALKKHYKRKIFLSKSFKTENHIDKVNGVYVPFWLFDCSGDGDVWYHATNSHTHREGDYEVTTTEHYNVHRAGGMDFSGIPADGSSKMPDDLMDSVEPYDYSELTEFSMAYMPGYLADKYDVSAKECAPRAETRCVNTVSDVLRNDVHGYSSVTVTSQNYRVTNGRISYAMLPVWLLYTKWKEKDYLFAMNGQSGKLVGNLPVSKGRFWLFVAGATAVMGALLFFTGGADWVRQLIGWN